MKLFKRAIVGLLLLSISMNVVTRFANDMRKDIPPIVYGWEDDPKG